jgi:hypothetical protein
MAINTTYQWATGCSEGPTPGAKALMAYYLGAYANRTDPRPANLGIYLCERLGSGWSLHAEGRAADLGTAPYSRPPWGWTLAEKLRLNSKELGVQLIIFDRTIWSANFPHAGWRNYVGSNPHTGHLHVELTQAAAKNLTTATIRNVLNPPKPAPAPAPTPTKNQPGTRVLRLASPLMRGPDVKHVQRWVGTRRAGPVDGIYGQQTVAGVRWYQRIRGITVDGIVGPVTWRHMGISWKG